MTTLAEHIIVVGAKNRPPMLEKSMYDSWASHIRLFIKGKKHGRMMLDSIDNDDCDVQAFNIILHGLPPDVYAHVNHQEAAKDIWDKVKLLMKGIELSYQECECRLYNLFDKMTMQQVQVNTKFLNALPPEWSKFVTDVKLAKSLYTTNYDQLYAYLIPTMHPPLQQFTPVYAAPIHHQQHHTPVNPLQQSVSPQPFISPSVIQQPQAEFPQLDFSLVVPTFQQGEDPIDCINKAMAFLSVVASRQAQSFASTGNRGIATTTRGNYAADQTKEKLMLSKAQEAGQILDEEQLAFIADLGIAEVQVAQQTIPQNSAFQTEDLDAYDSDCDDISSAKVVLMTNLSSYDSDVLSEVSIRPQYLT
ncbi:hypothetical protein Tco_1296041 [Tanacetum coccineum]